MAGKTLLITALLLSSVPFSATAKSDHYAFEHGITGYTPAQFARLCIKCQAQAMGKGRSVMGYCPGDCGDVYANEICEQGEAMHCRPGPESQLQAAGPVVPAKPASAAAKTSVAAPSVAQAGAKEGESMLTSANGGVFWTSYAEGAGLKFYLSCSASTHALSFTFNAEKYRGRVLSKIRDIEKPFVLNVKNISGTDQKFPFIAYFTNGDGDDAWVEQGHLTSAFLDAFGQDGLLSVQTEEGLEAASWALKGTAKVRDTMRNTCQL